MAAAENAKTGVFITFEGGDGSGKSTHVSFLAQTLRRRGYEVLCLREPGGTALSEALRALVLDPAYGEVSPRAELLIYEAARAQLVDEVIAPALARGEVVLCDRFFDSTVAYQAFGRGLPEEAVRWANEFAVQGTWPQRTILLTAGPVESALERATHDAPADRIEAAGCDFHERVAAGFRALAACEPERIRVVDSTQGKASTARAVFAQLADLFPWMADEVQCPDSLFAPLEDGSFVKGAER